MLRLKIRFWPALLVLAVVALTLRLGFWQRARAHQKEALAAHLASFEHAAPVPVGAKLIPLTEIEFRPVSARGRLMPEYAVYLDNRPHHGLPGFYVLMPLALNDGGYVLVERGWLPRDVLQRTALAPYDTPVGDIEVIGIARAHPPRLFELGKGGSAAHTKIRQNLEIEPYRAETGLPLQPFLIQQTNNDIDDHLIREWPAAINGVDRNYGYMVQWWAMSAVTLILGLYCAVRGAKRDTASE